MKINLFHNDFKKEIDIDISVKVGILQENILSYCLLMIYNIEYSEITINNNNENNTFSSYILGSDELLFEDTIESFLSKINLNEIEKIIIYDRKRDEFGNVIKENYIIDRYNRWYQIYENENYINYINKSQNTFQSIFQNINQYIPYENIPNQNIQNHLQTQINDESKEDESNEEVEESNNITNVPLQNVNTDYNRNIIRFPLTSILGNILRVPENIQEESNINNNETLIKNLIEDLLKNDSEPNNTEVQEEREEISNNLSNNNESINNMINIFDNYLHNYSNENYNTQYVNIFNTNIIRDFNNLGSINIFDEYADLPDLIPNNLYQEDVKIVLNDEQFNNLLHITHEEINNDESCECLICMDEFNKEDDIIKTNCKHLFHKNCIKTWLCEESNKCPICRIEIEKGIPK
jgi:hypothetical protein